ncbi:MAG: hypothetical protein COX77_03585 [Candidatus Komeilibacteria bacterium CG_4_10_14_0_2_um_filter_37_10]|uniref:Uncharacterized protein n=1 Tax=Candidatus Komeilibacteria bacterium CG_4_10_14_0_2_um_filter_37_10 TaxID=1974470 RepID=A0A2M7VDZ9_9BACT|nr:MAG: hypothetical protein COX77_03585 [Candidatus Komeilibacteria bacterium CG_4_10_14_0_2_um_filter_37_10]
MQKTVLFWSNFSLWDWTLGLLMKIFWEPVSLKRSHFWHWHKQNSTFLDSDYAYISVLPDPTVKDRGNWWQNFWQTNFGWQKVVVVATVDPNDYYQVAFSTAASNYQDVKLCSLVIRGRVALLVGPTKTRFYAIDYSYRDMIVKQLPLRIDFITKKTELSKQGIKLI